ncbi:MAG: glutamine--fructose-6-phosphate transaminase (isomerizing) [Nitrospirae bacterium]|nr:MAG: glutamine--fructose-6-phosphate transaminase (isomerizing) [Nitrospirota bacterium]
MCGIVGYIGSRPALPILIDGLTRLEYRGYDSAGVALLEGGRIEIRRAEGKLAALAERLRQERFTATLGIGHTRWATHGRPSEENAHPHSSHGVALVHNGIIENFVELRERLEGEGFRFASETDTEVIAHLIAHHRRAGRPPLEALRAALAEVRGAYAVAVLFEDDPATLYAARHGSPLVLAQGQGEAFLASDIPAILAHTREMLFLEDGDVAALTPEGIAITDLAGHPVERPVTHIDWNPVMAEKGGFKHFMLKEIHEQPRAINDTLAGRIDQGRQRVALDLPLDPDFLRGLRRVVMVACGTSWHAALVGKYMVEQLAGIGVEVDIASEFRYRHPIVGPRTLLVAISQSGETADTLAALRQAKAQGATTLAICNVVGSTMTREADATLYTHAGPEIGVASTKAFTTQLTVLYLLALHLGRANGRLGAEEEARLLHDLVALPGVVEEALACAPECEALAKRFAERRDFLYLGRGIHYPLALEGALKLKEISYIHAEGYPAGEMKHGPIALIDEEMPVVCLIPDDELREKMLSNVEEVRARDGQPIAVTQPQLLDSLPEGSLAVAVPGSNRFLTPVVMAVPLQLLAYYTAVRRGTDVDQPRNLAKSVTVE